MWSVGELTKQEEAEEKSKKTENLELYIPPKWGAAPIKLIATKFGNSFYLTDIIIRSKFGNDWYSSFGSGEVQSLPSPIELKPVLITCSPFGLARDDSLTLKKGYRA